MHTTQLCTAQLMGEYLGNESGKLIRKVSPSGFAEELNSQRCNHLGDLAAFSAHNGQPSANTSLEKTCESEALSPHCLLSTADETFTHNPSHKTTALRREFKTIAERKGNDSSLNPEHSNKADSSSDDEDIVFTNSLIIEEVITQLKLPAEKRAACLAAADDAGRIPLQSLLKIINDPEKEQYPSLKQPEVAAENVLLLFKSVDSSREANLISKAIGAKLKPEGTYNLEEFKGLLGQVASRISQEKKNASLVGSGSTKGSENAAVAGKDLESTKPSAPQQHPTSNLIAPFASTEDEKIDAAKVASPEQPQKTNEKLSSAEKVADGPVEAFKNGDTKPVGGKSPAASPDPGQPQPSLVSDKQITLTSVASNTESYSADVESFQNLAGNLLNDEKPAENHQNVTTDSSKLSLQMGAQAALVTDSGEDSKIRKLSGRDHRAEIDKTCPQEPAENVEGKTKSKAGSETGNESFRRQAQAQENHSLNGHLAKAAAHSNDDAFIPLPQNGHQASGTSLPAGAGGEKLLQEYVSSNDFVWVEKLARHIQSLTANNRDQLTLQLQSKLLGSLSVRVETKQNQVAAYIVADNEHAKSSLLQNAAVLTKSLQEHGLELHQMAVDVRGDGFNGNTSQDSRQNKRRRVGAPASSPGSHVEPVTSSACQSNGETLMINIIT